MNIFIIGPILIAILVVTAIICSKFGKPIWGGMTCFLGLGLLAIGIHLWQASVWRDISFVFFMTGALLELISLYLLWRTNLKGAMRK